LRKNPDVWKTRLLILTGTSILLLLGCEIVSFLVLSRKYETRFSYRVAAARRETSLNRLSLEQSDPGIPRHRLDQRIHPYLGAAPKGFFPGILAPEDYKRREGRILVAILGGSVANGLGNKAGEKLEADLSRRYPNHEVEVLNGGFGGCKQPQQLLLLTYVLSLGIEFDIIINLDGFNEVALHEAENGPKNVFPAYPRDWWIWVGKADGPAKTSLAELSVLRDRQVSALQNFSASLFRFSCTANLALDAYLNRQTARSQELQNSLRSLKGEEIIGPPFSGNEDELYEFLAKTWKNSSVQMDNLCRANQIAYFHFLQPNQYLEGSKPLTPEEKESAYDTNHFYRPGVVKGYPHLIKHGKDLERQLAFTDLTQIFKNNNETLYRDKCCHFNEQGSLLLEEAIFQQISENWEPSGRP
jgi:hypothetical protein